MNRALLALILTLTVNSQGEGLLADRARDIPITLNARVMRNLHIAKKSAGLKTMFARMDLYRPMIEAKLKAAGLPRELIAVPAVESMYRNTSESQTGSAGIWQLHPQTARTLGLRVDAKKDERYDPEKETDAAVAYLKYIYEQCGHDWMLTLLSYNAGETNVRKIVRATKTNDVFKLADQGQLKNKENTNYVAKILALMILIEHHEARSEKAQRATHANLAFLFN